MSKGITDLTLTDDTLKNIITMAPKLDEAGQNRVYGMMCGIMIAYEMKNGSSSLKTASEEESGGPGGKKTA